MLRRLGIRAKVMAVLAVPMIVLLAAGGFISWNAIQELRYAKAADSVITTLQAYTPVSSSLQAERLLSLNGGTAEEIAAARAQTDAALAAVRPITAELDLSQFPQPVVDRFVEVQLAHNTMLPAVRTGVDIKSQRAQLENNYAAIIEGQLSLMEQVANSLENRDLAQYVTAYREIGTTADNLVVELIDGIAAPQHPRAGPRLGPSVRHADRRHRAGPCPRPRRHRRARRRRRWRCRPRTRRPTSPACGRRSSRATRPASRRSTRWRTCRRSSSSWPASPRSTPTCWTRRHDVASAAADEAQTQALVTIGIVIAAVVASLFFALLVARGIVVPLRRLTKAAADVREQLPRLVEQVAVPGEGPEITLAPIPVTSRDEVGQLAAAFNSVNSTTVQVAQEQAALRGSIAEMFVNVARRDQVLLNRQLSFIDSLERAEEDPSTLANLFRLDHLATRMRRNAESLLVLAGIDSGRRLRDAMPLSDVVRTASSEIEQYDRVELDLQVDPHMHGFNALGAAHMLAELLENATIFSEPETPVTVTTGVSGQFVVVRILDQGLGMSDAELEAANSKIISTSASDSLGNQRLGLFVVGRIAQRLGADVRLLKAAHGTGTETIVRFPATLFVMTETNLYGNGAPAALAAPRNDPGLPQIEAPVVEEVDLAALTDGQTSLGLPHRRRRDDGSDEPVGPIPVTELAQSTGLPTRSKKTFDEDNLVLPEAPDGHIAPEISAAGSDWKPATVAPLKGGLPSRSRASTSAWAKPEEPAAAAAAAPPLRPPPVPVCSPASADAPRPPRHGHRREPRRPGPDVRGRGARAAARPVQRRPRPVDVERCARRARRADGRPAARGRRRLVGGAGGRATARRRTPRPPRLVAADAGRATEAAPCSEEAPVVGADSRLGADRGARRATPAWEAPAWRDPGLGEAAAAEAPAWEAPRRGGPGVGGARRRDPGLGRRLSPRPPRGRPPSRRPPPGTRPSPPRPPRGRLRRRRDPAWDDSVAAETPAWDEPPRGAPLEAPALGDAARRRLTAPPGTHRSSPRRPAWEAPAADASGLGPDDRRRRARLAGSRRRRGGSGRPDVALRRPGAQAEVAAPRPPPAAPVRARPDLHLLQRLRRLGRPRRGRAVPAVRAHARRGPRLAHRRHADRAGAQPSQLPSPSRQPVEPADEQAPAADDAAWPAPAWEPPTWQAPEWAEQPAEAAAEAEPVAEPEPEPELAVVDGVAFRRVYLEPDPEPATAEHRRRGRAEPEVAPEPEPVAGRRRPPWAAPVQEAAPAWPTFQAPHPQVEAPTQMFTPIEAAAAVDAGALAYPQAPAYQQAPVAFAAPEPAAAPAWAPTAPAPAAPAAQAPFSELVCSRRSPTTPRVAAAGVCSVGRRATRAPRRPPAPSRGQVAPEPASQVAPVRTSAWTAEAAAPQSPTGADSSQSWMASTTWSAPAARRARCRTAPAPLEPASAGSWSPPEWAARPAATARRRRRSRSPRCRRRSPRGSARSTTRWPRCSPFARTSRSRHSPSSPSCRPTGRPRRVATRSA